MSKEDSEQFLQNMKELVRKGQRHFVKRTRYGKNYIQMLADIGLTSIDEAWECVLQLEKDHYCKGPEIDYIDGPESAKVVWIFKMDINETTTYIKLKDETAKRGCVCLSFHEDEQ